MDYVFKTDINKKEYDKFVANFPSTNFMQTTNWANVKNFWDNSLVGMYKNGKLVCAASILKRNVFLNKKLFYIPRGFVIDYNDEELLKQFVCKLKTYAKEENAIDIKIDPFVCFNQDNIQNIKNNKNIETKKKFCINTDVVVKSLKNLGFKHAGYRKEIDAYTQPRYTMVIPLKDNNDVLYEKETLKRSFPKNTRNYIGDYQKQRGVEFSYSTNIDDAKKLASVIQCTEKRQNVTLRGEQYFRSIMKSFPEHAVLFFAHVDIDKYLEFLKQDMKNNESKKEFCEKQILEAKRIKEQYGSKPLAGATIVIMPTCKKGIRMASFLYAGNNTDIFPSLKITNGLVFYRLCYCLDNNCDYANLGGIDGSLNDHLSIFKSKFNPEVLELIGEYDLVISKFWFFLFKISVNIINRIRFKK